MTASNPITHDRIVLGGFVSIAALFIALFVWLRDDVRGDIERIETAVTELRRAEAANAAGIARIEGVISGVLGRPFPAAEPPAAPGDGEPEPRAAD